LDEPTLSATARNALWGKIGHALLDALMNSQEDLSREHHTAPSEFEHTLAAVVFGAVSCGTIQIGDSCIALVRDTEARLAFAPQNGEYANETNFVELSPLVHSTAVFGIFDMAELSAAFAFSDGVSYKWVHAFSHQPARCVGQVAAKVGCGEWADEEIRSYLENREFWRESDDDRSIAYLVKTRTSTPRPPNGTQAPQDLAPASGEEPDEPSDCSPKAASATSPGDFLFTNGIAGSDPKPKPRRPKRR
jgi:hypothetical protein